MDTIAIIGVSCKFPGSEDINNYWELLKSGKNAISKVPESRFDVESLLKNKKIISDKGGFINNCDKFDAEFFNVTNREAQLMDPQQRITLETCLNALENAKQQPSMLQGSNTGVFLGISGSEYGNQSYASSAFFGTGNAAGVASGRISYFLGLEGPSISIDTAQSSSMTALHLACQSLKTHECDMAIAGGVNLILSPDKTIAYSKAGMLSPDGQCKPFDESANGYVRSEGCGIIILKRIEDAENNGDNIWCTIEGTAVSQDGHSETLTSPSTKPQQVFYNYILIGCYEKGFTKCWC